MRWLLVLVMVLAMGCKKETPPVVLSPEGGESLAPANPGFQELVRLTNLRDKPPMLAESLLKIQDQFDMQAKTVGRDKADAWLYSELADKTPEQVIDAWGPKAGK